MGALTLYLIFHSIHSCNFRKSSHRSGYKTAVNRPKVASKAGTEIKKRFHKDNLRHLPRFPDFFVTFRILSFEISLLGISSYRNEATTMIYMFLGVPSYVFLYFNSLLETSIPSVSKDLQLGTERMDPRTKKI